MTTPKREIGQRPTALTDRMSINGLSQDTSLGFSVNEIRNALVSL